MKARKNKQLPLLLLLGGAFMLLQRRPAYSQQYSAVPPPPKANSPQYLQWVKFVVDNYGKVADLWKPGGPFYKEPVPKYDAGSQFWQDLSNVAGIAAIYKRIPPIYECNDGTYSTSEGRRACVRHGGRKSDSAVEFGGGGRLNIRDIPLNEIRIDRKLFQGREKEFSQRSVDNILSDVEQGRFQWANLDPITLWLSPDGFLYLLSGHSRFEAFRQLAGMNATADGKDFRRIPAKILQNIPINQARTLALESNTLSTKETDIERAQYYRKIRQDGQDEKRILEAIKKNEGRNWTNVYAYTFLNPSGRTWGALRLFANKEDTSATLAKSLSKWIGMARRQFPMLTGDHENELYAWLFEQKGYGTGSAQVSNEREFMDQVAAFIQKNIFMGQFDRDKPLNIQCLLYKSPTEQAYAEQINQARQAILDTEKELRNKIKRLTDQKASRADIQRIVAPIEAQLRNQRIVLQQLMQKQAQVIEYSKNEATLFGIGRIIPPWQSATAAKRGCRHAGYSTTATSHGGCSWHGGFRQSEYDTLKANWAVGMKRRLRQKGLSIPATEAALYQKYVANIGPYPTLSEFRKRALR